MEANLFAHECRREAGGWLAQKLAIAIQHCLGGLRWGQSPDRHARSCQLSTVLQAFQAIIRCGSMTPFGRPVVPLV